MARRAVGGAAGRGWGGRVPDACPISREAVEAVLAAAVPRASLGRLVPAALGRDGPAVRSARPLGERGLRARRAPRRADGSGNPPRSSPRPRAASRPRWVVDMCAHMCFRAGIKHAKPANAQSHTPTPHPTPPPAAANSRGGPLSLLDGNKPSPPPPGTPSTDAAGEAVDPAHACSVLKQLRTMYEEGQLTDIVVEVDRGKAFSCHRNVLAAISPYFRYEGGGTAAGTAAGTAEGPGPAHPPPLPAPAADTVWTRCTEMTPRRLFPGKG